ncbi:multifunctional CCA addition/repair protein [Aquimonas voraii]|uniref:Multifunctional CCA protein n=1 Tax=Aquimonas voraii TaxID=265719 RepID=A0A1G6WBH4_9GAMM|nr:multifunctional CCA addition/repair protein [Aquimonas voraii]SDD63139.1 tRNA nucleotidyltransferase (CCA-adding enzyme) [Aquimonas voraii]
MSSFPARPSPLPPGTYLVGGAVRDLLLDRPVGECDWVVVGSTQAAMEAMGFRAVGADFPVFLHPVSGEEYALARTERKSGRGYRGFVVDADPSVTLEDDLQRRDLTLNAIAMAPDGRLVDPWGGRADIEARLLRHVSPAFAEDPVRILRVARFAARFAPQGFRVAAETLALMRQMVANGEVDHLVPERVWKELSRGLAEPAPQTLLRVLRECGALARLLPEVDALYGVPQRPEYHPEIDTGLHIELCLEQSAKLRPGDTQVAFAVLVHDLGKALTPAEELPRHIAHEERGLEPIRAVCERLRVPVDARDLALHACREHLNVHRLHEMRAASIEALIQRCDGYRRPERIAQIGWVCEIDKRGRAGLADQPYPNRERLDRCHRAALGVQARDLDLSGLKGPEVGEALKRARVAAISAVIASDAPS